MKKKCSFCNAIYAETEFFCPECAGLVFDLIDDAQANAYQSSGRQASSAYSSANTHAGSASGASSAYGSGRSSRPASVQDAYRVERVGRPAHAANPTSGPSAGQKKSAAPTTPAKVDEKYRVERITPLKNSTPESAPAQKSEPAAPPVQQPTAPKKKASQPAAHAMSVTHPGSNDVEARRMQLMPMTADWYSKESLSVFSHKATGKLQLEKDGLLYHIKGGSSMGYIFGGLLGIYLANKKAKKNGTEAFIPYQDIALARKSEKVINLFSSLVLEMKNGELICFSLAKSQSKRDELIALVNDLIALHT